MRVPKPVVKQAMEVLRVHVDWNRLGFRPAPVGDLQVVQHQLSRVSWIIIGP